MSLPTSASGKSRNIKLGPVLNKIVEEDEEESRVIPYDDPILHDKEDDRRVDIFKAHVEQ